VFLLCGLFSFVLFGQEESKDPLPRYLREVGLPFVQIYTIDNYKGNNQVWEVVQDSKGIMYFANSMYILVFDGVNWDKIATPNLGAAKSLAIDKNDRVYVGASGEFGYLDSDTRGKLKYISLLPQLDDEIAEPNTIWDVHVTSDGTFFNGNEFLYIYSDKLLRKVDMGKNEMFISKAINDTIYYSEIGKGLMYLNNDIPVLLNGGEELANYKIYSICPWKNNSLLVGTYGNGLFLYEDGVVTPFNTEVDTFLKSNNLYSGIRLSNGDYAFGTLKGGLVVIDLEGRMKLRLDQNILPSIAILDLFNDENNNLWATTNGGIARIEYPTPFSVVDKRNGLGAPVNDIVRYKGQLYFGTFEGLFIFNGQSSTGNYGLVNVMGIKDKVWDLLVVDDMLLVGLEDATYQLKNNRFTKISEKEPSSFFRSKINTNRVFVPGYKGTFSLRLEDAKWIDEGFIDGIDGEAYSIVEEQNGNLWINPYKDFLWHVILADSSQNSKIKVSAVEKITREHNYPNDYNYMHIKNGNLFLNSVNSKKSYTYDSSSKKFKRDKSLSEKFNLYDSLYVYRIDELNNAWLKHHPPNADAKSMFVGNNGSMDNSILDLNEERINHLIEIDRFVEDSILWHFFDKPQAIRHDLRVNSEINTAFANIRGIDYKVDSTIYYGHGNKSKQVKKVTVPFENNRFRFKFSLPGHHHELGNDFQVQLKEYDKKWSNWSKETQKDYTNLPEGDYTFKVRAKNVYGKISEEDSYSFTILPPWYRTWWAYFLYILGAILFLVFFSQWRSQQLRNKNLALEALVDERTGEIREKNKLLGYQTERLKELDTMKTRLFANISHEFRTPLTLIKGPIEKLESAGENKISTPNMKMIRRNANRLLNLVNQLLDLSKLESGKLKLNAAEGDVFKCIRAAASAFSSHAASRKMDYQIKIPADLLWCEFDRDKLEKIVYNLLSNAFKFTNDEGRITIESEFRSGRLKMKVSDSGSGIAKDKLPHIFDRFFQVDDSYTKEKAGSGIGLALTKELVELMGGTIYVESEQGKGTAFRVLLPLEEIKSNRSAEFSEELVPVFDEGMNELPETPTAEKDIKILIIEDNNDMRHFIREQLEDEYAILEARNGKEGLKMANKIIPDLIVTDLMMPQMDGITLCKKLKTDLTTSHIPVIMLTAKAGIENKLEGLETGADEYLTKPFNAEELQIRTKNLIDQRQQLRELFSKNISLDPKSITVTSLDEDFLNSLLALFEEKYNDSAFGVPQIQKAVGVSKTALHSKVKALTNHPPGELLRNFRLKRAAQLLLQKGDNVSQIAYDTGFNSLSYFTRCFKEYYGSSPSEYIKNNGSES